MTDDSDWLDATDADRIKIIPAEWVAGWRDEPEEEDEPLSE